MEIKSGNKANSSVDDDDEFKAAVVRFIERNNGLKDLLGSIDRELVANIGEDTVIKVSYIAAVFCAVAQNKRNEGMSIQEIADYFIKKGLQHDSAVNYAKGTRLPDPPEDSVLNSVLNKLIGGLALITIVVVLVVFIFDIR
jgi:hypothetical protein